MIIPYSYSEAFSTTQEHRAVALFVAHKWREEGKNVRLSETTTAITVQSVYSGVVTSDAYWNIEGKMDEST